MKKKQLILPIIVMILLIPIFTGKSDPIGILYNQSTYSFYVSPTKFNSGTYFDLISNNSFSELNFRFDYMKIELDVSVSITDVKNIGENVSWFIGLIVDTNNTHFGFRVLDTAIHTQQTNYVGNVKVVRTDNLQGESIWVENNYNYSVNDIFTEWIVDGTVTLSGYALVNIGYYQYEIDIDYSLFQDDDPELSVWEFITFPISIPLILIFESDDLIQIMIGIMFLIIEIWILIKIYKVFFGDG